MSDTRFLEIMELLEQRIQGISQAEGFFYDLGASVYVEGLSPVPLDEYGSPIPSTVLIDPGEVSLPEESGEIRASTATLEARFDREVSIIVIWPIDDKSQWLLISERIAADLRRAMFADQNEWRQAGVSRLAQTGQESSWPESGSSVLMSKVDFQINYIEQ